MSQATEPNVKQLATYRAIRAYEEGWFGRLRQQAFHENRPYVLSTLLIPREIFEAMDLLPLEDMGLVEGLKSAAAYSDLLDEHGYHRELGGAVALGSGLPLAVALDESNPGTWFSGMPKPAIIVSTASDRAAQTLAAHFRIPHFGVETPAVRQMVPTWWEMTRWQWEDLDESYRIELMRQQYQEIISECERVVGRKFDIDRLREVIERVNRQQEYFEEIRELICRAPKMPFRMREAERMVLSLQHQRGTQWALDQARAFRDEVKARCENEQWICPNERYRLNWNGTLLPYTDNFYDELESTHGIVFARSLYLSIAPDAYLRYGLKDPLRALASRYTTLNQQMHIPPLSTAWMLQDLARHRVDGVLHQLPWEWYDFITQAVQDAGIPVLKLTKRPGARNRAEMQRAVTEFVETRVAPLHR
jgi:hypothetical protein